VRSTTVIAVVMLIVLALVAATKEIGEARASKRSADADRRERMRQEYERRHFRDWENEFRSTDWV
jgi:hypothetical protein